MTFIKIQPKRVNLFTFLGSVFPNAASKLFFNLILKQKGFVESCHQKLFTMPRATPRHSCGYWKAGMRKWPTKAILGLQEQETQHIVLRTVRLGKESLKSHKSGEYTQEKAGRKKNMKKYQTLEKSGKVKTSSR